MKIDQPESPADTIAPVFRQRAELAECGRLFRKYYNRDFGGLMDTVQQAREAAERDAAERKGKR